MNASSKPAAPSSLNDWLAQATRQLAAAGISTARLDAELILAHVLGVERTWLIAHGDEPFPATPAGEGPTLAAALAGATSSPSGEDSAFPAGARQDKDWQAVGAERVRDEGDEVSAGYEFLKKADNLLAQRLQRVPLSYLIGHKEFYGRSFAVTPDTLIPRPESETLIELLIELAADTPARLLDVGTGSGCLAITAKLEIPRLDVTASDVSPAALAVAAENAGALGAILQCVQSDLLASINGAFEYIVANLPYVDRAWTRSPETGHEPPLALFAGDGGLNLIYQLIEQAPSHLVPGGCLLLEADPEQHDRITTEAKKHNLTEINRRGYIVVLQKNA